MSSDNSADQKIDVRFWLKKLAWLGVAAFILCLVCYFYFLTVERFFKMASPTKAAEFGEMFGGLSAVLGGCALIAASLAYIHQQREYRLQVQATEDQKGQNDRQITIAAYTAKLQYLTHLHKFNNERIQSPDVAQYRQNYKDWASDNFIQLKKVAATLDRMLEQTTDGKAKKEQAEMRPNHGVTVHCTTPKAHQQKCGPAWTEIASYSEKTLSVGGKSVNMIWICSPNVDHDGLKWLKELPNNCHCGSSMPALYLLTKRDTLSDPNVLTALCDWETSFKSPVFVRTNTANEFVNANLGLFVMEPKSPDPRGILDWPATTYFVTTAWLASCNLSKSALGLGGASTQCETLVTAHDKDSISSISQSFLWFWNRFDYLGYETKKIDSTSRMLISV